MAVGLQPRAHALQADLEHGYTLAQAGDRIQAHRPAGGADPGAIQGAWIETGGPQPHPSPTQSLVGPQVERMAHHPADLPLEDGFPKPVALPQGGIQGGLAYPEPGAHHGHRQTREAQGPSQ